MGIVKDPGSGLRLGAVRDDKGELWQGQLRVVGHRVSREGRMVPFWDRTGRFGCRILKGLARGLGYERAMVAKVNEMVRNRAARIEDRLSAIPGLEAVHDRVAVWRDDSSFSLPDMQVHAMLLSLRRLDAINMAYGAAAGDGALEEVATRISHFADEELDGPWLVARAGGGSFLLVANEACTRERWQLVADQLADMIARPIALPRAFCACPRAWR
ncbi:diguanylate cyclase domain-containing protein [Novosphingobium panipatense]|uniref:diguanylate cyclase domain-containing protein n=1 Tax=Novosphingobium panipatense TaxID=428991 RepID=UPI00360BFD9A